MKPKINPFATVLALTVVSATSIFAAPLYWKTSTAAVWDSASWSSVPNGPYTEAWVSGSQVTFEENGGIPLTITGATTNFASITANENVTLTASGTLGTGGAIADVDVASGKTLDFAAQNISTATGTGFVKKGAGTWSLANGNTYTGGFTLNAGTVAVGGVNAMGGGTGGTLTLNGGTLRSTSTAARDLTNKYDLGITLGGDVTFGDATNNGLLTFSNNTDLGAATRTLTVNSNATFNGIISGATGVGITKTGPGILTLGGTNTYTGSTTVSEGIFNITKTGALPGFNTSGSYSVASGAALTVANAVTDADIAAMLVTTNFAAGSAIGFDTFSGARTYGVVLADTAQGSLGLVKIGANALTLSTANTYSGGTIISNAHNSVGIIVDNASALGSGAVVVKGSQNFSGSVSVNTGLTVANALTLKRGNGGSNRAILGLAASSSWSGPITVDNTSANGLAVISAGGTNTATASIVSGNIGFSTLGTGNSLVLRSGTGKVSGSISLSTGTLQILDASKWEFSNASNTWGTLDISHASAIVTVGATNTLSSSGVVSSTVGGTLQLNDQAGLLAYDQSVAGLNGNVKVGLLTGAATLTLNTSADQTSSGVISGAISLVKSGPAKQTLTGANTYTGSTTISGGTLTLGTTGALPITDLSISSGTLDLRKGSANRTQLVNDLTLSNATLEIGLHSSADQIDALTPTVSGTNTLKLYGGVPVGTYNLITTTGALSGTFVLDTTNVTPSGFPTSYSGAIEGSNYVLTVSGAATPPVAYWHGDVSSVWNEASAAPNSNWATDSTGATDAGQVAGAISDVYFSTATAANTTTTLGADTLINSLTFESGTAEVGGANTLTILGTGTSGNGLDVLSGADATLDTSSLVSTGTSAVQTGGILTLFGGGLGSGPVLVDGTLNLNTNATIASLTGFGTITSTVAGTSNLTVAGTTNSTFDGAINDAAGTMALVKGGTSTLTLAGTSNFTGGTTISQSNNATALVIANGSALGTGPVIANGSQQFSPTLTVNAGLTVANALTLKRGLSGSGRAVVNLGSGSTWSGDITLDNTTASGFAAILAGGSDAATASIVSGNIGFSTLGSGDINNPHLGLRNSNGFGKVTGSISLSTGYLQLIDSSKWEFSNASNTWGTLDIKHAGAIATVGATNTLSPSGVVFSNSGGTLRLNSQDGTTAYDQAIAGLSGNVKVGLTTGAATLTVNTTTDQSASGAISGAISLVKDGAAIQTLSGVNTYTGNTTVNAGTLAVADNAQLTFAIGATPGSNNSISGAGTVTLEGDFNIDTALTDASALTAGTWTLENVASLPGAYGTNFQVVSGATAWTATGDVWTKSVGSKNYSFDETTGVLTLSSSGGFDAWAASKGLIGGDAAFDADPDNDGLNNGLEFVLGGEPNPANPSSNSAALLPTVSQSSGDLIFTFKRKDISESGVTLKFQWSTDLSFPTPANDVPVGATDSTTDTIEVVVTEDVPDDDTDTIVITVPAAKAAGGKLFGRLNAIKAP